MRVRPSFLVSFSARHPRSTDALLSAAVLAALATSGAGQLQFDELRKRGLPGDRDDTYALASGDVDLDGDVDVVVGNGGQNRLYLNDGTGTYADATAGRMPPDDDSTEALALGDVDLDGDLDLVVGNLGEQNRLYLNDGTGTFTDATATRMPADRDLTHAAALGDVDADGDLDLVLGNGHRYAGFRQQDKLYLNDGTGTYSDVTGARMPADADDTRAVAIGDVDGDGDLDVVLGIRPLRAGLVGYAGGQNLLYLNDGTGRFTDGTAGRMPPDADFTNAVALADVDIDRDLDLVLANGSIVSYGRQNRLYINDGTGIYVDATAARMPSDSDPTRALTLGDVDSDGDPDVVLGNYGEQNRLYLNDGAGVYADVTPARLPADVDLTHVQTLVDVDGDDDLDLIVGNTYRYGEFNRLYLNDGSASYTDATRARLPVASGATLAVAFGDVDLDGDVDLVVGKYSDQSRLLVNDGSGVYTDATGVRMPARKDATSDLALGDVDLDGDLDIVVANYSGPNRLYLNDGAGTYTDATAGRMPAHTDDTTAVALGDVDGDGDLDIVFANWPYFHGSYGASYYSRGGQNRLYLNDGAGTFTDATGARMPFDTDDTTAAVLGDVDSDGDLDILFGNGNYGQPYGRHQNRLYLNDGSGTYSDATAARVPIVNSNTFTLALGDVDADGDLDIVCGNFRQQDRLYLNDGSGSYTDATVPRMPADNGFTNAVALGDIDVDGDVDVAFADSQRSRLYLNDGTGAFRDVTAARMPVGRAFAVGAWDIDADDDPDIVFGSDDRLCFNLRRQLDAPFLLRSGRSFTLEAYARHGPRSLVDVAVPFVSTGTASIPLPPFGTFGLDPRQMVPVSPFVIPQPAGVGAVTFPVPHVPSVAGIALRAQALLVPYPFQARLTNVTADVLLR